MQDEKIKEAIEALTEDFQQSLIDLVGIASVLKEAEAGMPFGPAIAQALKQALTISKRLGFKTYMDPEGYYGYAEIGTGEEMIGILGHIDVVDAGHLKMWHTPPFEGVIKEGKLFGRGASDDKGPMLAVLFAVKALMNLDHTFNKRVRFIFGTDEENLWRCMEAYTAREEIPCMGFTPDATFPLVYAEKGLLQVKLTGENKTKLCFEVGDTLNAVPAEATYTGVKQEALKRQLNNLGFPYKSDHKGVTVLGKSAHAMATEQGENAVNRLLIALKEVGITSKIIDFVFEKVRENPYGELIFGTVEDAVSGKLKMNVGKVMLTESHETMMIDLRIPVTEDKDKIVNQLMKIAHLYGLEYEEYDYLKSLYVPIDTPLIQTLMAAYQEVTGDLKNEPVSTGGATYARAMDNFVAFGAGFSGQNLGEHRPNEHIELNKMSEAMLIYAKAIFALIKEN